VTPNVGIVVTKPVFDHAARSRIQFAEPARKVSEAKDRVPANIDVLVPGELEAER
jgi:hypothetical protein